MKEKVEAILLKAQCWEEIEIEDCILVIRELWGENQKLHCYLEETHKMDENFAKGC